MKMAILLVAILFSASLVQAQSLTGVWRGYFYSGLGLFQQRYKFEVQINELKNHSLRGVTYSYSTTSFYGKAGLKGIYHTTSDNIVMKEDTLLEVRGSSGSTCLMTCYLDYMKNGNTETLTGTYTSVVAGTGGDCGKGSVYLERVETSEFKKEDFLVKKQPPRIAPSARKPAAPPTQQPKRSTPPRPKDSLPVVSIPVPPADTTVKPPAMPVPPALKERTNNLVKRLITNSSDIKIDLYDNGEIDGDTITVFHNNEVVAFQKGLSKKPITINLKATVQNNIHEFVMYADNLGKIPPNTALMVVTTGGRRYELSITSTKEKNAKVIVEYRPDATDTDE